MHYLALFLGVFLVWIFLLPPKTSTEAIGACIVGAVLGLATVALTAGIVGMMPH